MHIRKEYLVTSICFKLCQCNPGNYTTVFCITDSMARKYFYKRLNTFVSCMSLYYVFFFQRLKLGFTNFIMVRNMAVSVILEL